MAKSSVIDAWRGLAALLVALLHARLIFWIGMHEYQATHGLTLDPTSWLAYLTAPISAGALGVSFFFVISGFCIHSSYSNGARFASRRYFASRALRIFPPFAASLFLTAALDSYSVGRLGGTANGWTGPDNWTTFFGNLATLQNMVVPPYGSNGALWSLAVEMHLYLAYPLLLTSRRKLGLTSTTILVGVFNAASVLSPLGHYQFFTNYIFVWWLGALAIEQQKRIARPWLAASGLGAILTGALLVHNRDWLAFQIAGIGFALVLPYSLRACSAAGSMIINSLATVGTFSYSLYLVHMPLFFFLRAIIFGGDKQESIVPALLSVCLAIPIALGFYSIAERPAVRLLTRLKEKANVSLARA